MRVIEGFLKNVRATEKVAIKHDYGYILYNGGCLGSFPECLKNQVIRVSYCEYNIKSLEGAPKERQKEINKVVASLYTSGRFRDLLFQGAYSTTVRIPFYKSEGYTCKWLSATEWFFNVSVIRWLSKEAPSKIFLEALEATKDVAFAAFIGCYTDLYSPEFVFGYTDDQYDSAVLTSSGCLQQNMAIFKYPFFLEKERNSDMMVNGKEWALHDFICGIDNDGPSKEEDEIFINDKDILIKKMYSFWNNLYFKDGKVCLKK